MDSNQPDKPCPKHKMEEITPGDGSSFVCLAGYADGREEETPIKVLWCRNCMQFKFPARTEEGYQRASGG